MGTQYEIKSDTQKNAHIRTHIHTYARAHTHAHIITHTANQGLLKVVQRAFGGTQDHLAAVGV
jgi:hypothetical protein